MTFPDENRMREFWQTVKNKIDSLIPSINTAQQTANTAASAAEAAQSSANNAKSAADNAQSTANAAKATAEAALPKSGGTIDGSITFIAPSNTPSIHFNKDAIAGKMHFWNSDTDYSFATAPYGAIVPEQNRIQIGGIANPSLESDASNKLYVDSSIVRKNILDNAYFLNSVNQRAKYNYSGIGYTIDRWKLVIASASLDVNNGITLNAGSGFALLQQFFEDTLYSTLLGKRVTLSVMFSDGSIKQATQTFPQTKPTTSQPFCNIPYSDGAITIYASANQCLVQIYVNANSSVSLAAMKLEIGSFQTLAHQENGEWVLNEIQDYGTELLKCQRYQFSLFTNQGPQGYVAITTAVSGNTAYGYIPLPVTLRAMPSIISSCSANKPFYCFGVFTNGYNGRNEVTQINIYSWTNSMVIVVITSTNLVPGNQYQIFTDYTDNPFLILDSNL